MSSFGQPMRPTEIYWFCLPYIGSVGSFLQLIFLGALCMLYCHSFFRQKEHSCFHILTVLTLSVTLVKNHLNLLFFPSKSVFRQQIMFRDVQSLQV